MSKRWFRFLCITSCLVLLGGPRLLQAAEAQLKVEPGMAPSELSADIRALLAPTVIRVIENDKPVMEFWLRSDIPFSAAPKDPSKALDALKQPVLFGAVRIPSASRDYRDDELPEGIYTMRFGLQPSDGNHLGSSDFAYFAVLIPAQSDTKPDGVTDYKALTKASSKETSTGHPLILSLRPVTGPVGQTPSLQEPAADHKCVRVSLPGRAGEAKADVVFDLVFSGKAAK